MGSAGQARRRRGAERRNPAKQNATRELGTTATAITPTETTTPSVISQSSHQSVIECRRLSHHRARAVSQVFRFSGFGTSTSKPSVRAQQRTHARRIDYERVSRSRTDVPSDFGSRRMDDDDDDDDGSTVHVSLSLLSFSVSIITTSKLPTNCQPTSAPSLVDSRGCGELRAKRTVVAHIHVAPLLPS